jgi:DNA topoisomerase-1
MGDVHQSFCQIDKNFRNTGNCTMTEIDETLLSELDLRFTSDTMPGYSRKRAGSGFAYLNEDGRPIHNPKVREWIKKIGIPPAWKDVWISPTKNGHILATGRDAKGRKQYRYHPAWMSQRNENKFHLLAEFGRCLPDIRERIDHDLRQHSLSRTRVLAAVVYLLANTLIRVGNDKYAQMNDSYGLTTLQDGHIDVRGSKITFEFTGKSGKDHTITLDDARLARVVKLCRDIPGYELFQYYDEDGNRQVIDSADVNAYLREITDSQFTAKVFRTWGGSTLAIKHLAEDCDEADTKKAIRGCVAHVAQQLGNTKAVSLKYYIHPVVLQAHEDGTLAEVYKKQQKKRETPYGLLPEEHTLIALIKQAEQAAPSSG